MKPLSPAFNRASAIYDAFSTFVLILWVLAIDEDRQRREKERRRKRQAVMQPKRRPAHFPAPCPF